MAIGSKTRSQYRCSECHHIAAKWVGRCPDCGTWGTVDEVVLTAAALSPTRRAVVPTSPAVPLSSIDPGATRHFHTGVSELDRVLGGGLVPGSVTLLAGDPGVGKSTLLLEVANRWAQTGRRALYLSGEESAGQIRLRAERTNCAHDEVYLAAESDLQTALGHIEAVQPSLVVVDSVQTMSTAEVDGVTGGVTQVRAVTTALTMTAKTTGVAILLVGHVLLDEPTNGLDPPQITAMRQVLADYAAAGRTVVVSSHMLAEVEQTCDHVVVMARGHVLLSESTATLTGDGRRRLEEAFLDLLDAETAGATS